MEHASQENQPNADQGRARDPFFLVAVGPSFLALALCALLLWIAPFMTPFVLLAGGGWLLTWGFKTKGLILSFLSLAAVAVWQFSLLTSQVWCSLFLGAIALSWMILWMGQREVFDRESDHKEQIKELDALREQAMSLQRMMEARLESLQGETEEKLSVQERKTQELASSLECALQELKNTQGFVEAKEHESEIWMRRCESLTLEVSAFQEREKMLEAELVIAQGPANPVVSQESNDEVGEQAAKDFLEMQMQYRQLQDQFQEKSDLLHQTRKELFQKEGELILLLKEQEDAIASLCREDQAFHAHLDVLAEQCQELENESVHLEAIISMLVAPKKLARPRKTVSKKKAALPDLLQEVMEKSQSSQQISLLD
jgi:hypothetical protein